MPARRKSAKTKKQPPSHRVTRDVLGLMLIALGIFALVSVFFTGLTGAFGEAVMDVLFGLFGVMAYIMPLFTIVIGWLVMISWQIRVHKGKLGSVTALFLLFVSLLHLFYDGAIRAGAETAPGYGAYLALVFRYGVENGGGTGVLGGLLAWPLNHFLGRAGAFIFTIAGLIGCIALLTRFSLGSAGRRVTEAAYAATASAIGQARERRKTLFEDDDDVRAKERKSPEPYQPAPSLLEKREEPKRSQEPSIPYNTYEPQLDVPQNSGGPGGNVRYMDERLSEPRRKLPNEQIRAMKGSKRRPEPDIIDLSTGQKISIHSIREKMNEAPGVTPFPMEPMEDGEFDNIAAFERENAYFQMPHGVFLEPDDEPTRERAGVDLESSESLEAWEETSADEEWTTLEAPEWDSGIDALPDNLDTFDETTLDEMGLPLHERIEDEGVTIPEELPDIDAFEPEPELALPMPTDEPVLASSVQRSAIDHAFGNPSFRTGGANPTSGQSSPSDYRETPPLPPPPPPYKRPQLDLLSRPANTEAAELRARSEQEERANLLLSTLKSFGINSTVVGISRGPTLTRYELKPAAGIKVSRIVSLSDDIAMNMAAAGVRIEAPIPGKAAIGIEVPNLETFPVALREVLTSDEFQNHKSRLAIAFGMDITGKPVVGDLADMPHLLIAGATGSGKSVCINSLVTSILYKSSPDEVKMIMIDPKVVELSVYNGIPHLLIPVVTDPKKAAGALNWAVQEMESRYKKFAATNSRDLKGYNAYAKANGMETIYQLVVIVDELADLMIVASREVEEHINRLAQLARAAGIHLVIATQRPSVNVITGVIKANIPSRIAFAVASQVDSRTILDMAGAEKLLGRGDMLFHPRGASKPRRVQGCLITDAEVHRVVDVVKRTNGEVLYNPDVIETLERMDTPAAEQPRQEGEDGDDLLRQAIELALDAGQVSASMLQRRYRIGYARAGRLIDEMEQRGIISGHEGSKPREVLLSREEFNRMYLQ